MRLYSRRWFGLSCYAHTAGGELVYHMDCTDGYEGLTRMKRRTAGGGKDGPRSIARTDSKVLTKFAGIIAHCSVVRYDDGSPRKPGDIKIKTVGTCWAAEAVDPDGCCVLRVIQTSLDDALTVLNIALESEETPWEPAPWLVSGGGKGKK